MLDYLSRWMALGHFPLVRYVPAGDPDSGGRMPDRQSSSRRDVVLESQHARCYVCLEDYPPPSEPSRLMHRPRKLRMLPCAHVFHVSTIRAVPVLKVILLPQKSCIDRWLIVHGTCALCRKDVFQIAARCVSNYDASFNTKFNNPHSHRKRRASLFRRAWSVIKHAVRSRY